MFALVFGAVYLCSESRLYRRAEALRRGRSRPSAATDAGAGVSGTVQEITIHILVGLLFLVGDC